MVVAAHPLAAQAGYDVLGRGGGAVDAAIAAELVLNLVEPPVLWIGGGGFLLHYTARDGRLEAYDGRENRARGGAARTLSRANGKPSIGPTRS